MHQVYLSILLGLAQVIQSLCHPLLVSPPHPPKRPCTKHRPTNYGPKFCNLPNGRSTLLHRLLCPSIAMPVVVPVPNANQHHLNVYNHSSEPYFFTVDHSGNVVPLRSVLENADQVDQLFQSARQHQLPTIQVPVFEKRYPPNLELSFFTPPGAIINQQLQQQQYNGVNKTRFEDFYPTAITVYAYDEDQTQEPVGTSEENLQQNKDGRAKADSSQQATMAEKQLPEIRPANKVSGDKWSPILERPKVSSEQNEATSVDRERPLQTGYDAWSKEQQAAPEESDDPLQTSSSPEE